MKTVYKLYIQDTKLNAHIDSLVLILGIPWTQIKKNRKFRRSLTTIVESIKIYYDLVVGMQQHTANNHSRKEHFEEYFG